MPNAAFWQRKTSSLQHQDRDARSHAYITLERHRHNLYGLVPFDLSEDIWWRSNDGNIRIRISREIFKEHLHRVARRDGHLRAKRYSDIGYVSSTPGAVRKRRGIGERAHRLSRMDQGWQNWPVTYVCTDGQAYLIKPHTRVWHCNPDLEPKRSHSVSSSRDIGPHC